MSDPHQLVDAIRARFGERSAVTDPADIEPWLNDWRGRWHGNSLAILQPQSAEEVAAIVALANEHGVPLVPQGGNTSMVGGATPPADGSALILSLRRMNRVRAIDRGAMRAVAEAGVVLQTLHEAALGQGLRFPLTLGAKGSATIGGLISTNAGGTQVLRFGPMRALVDGIEAVLPDGTIHNGSVRAQKDNRGTALTSCLVGAEGTLGIVTAARLRLVHRDSLQGGGMARVGSPQRRSTRCARCRWKPTGSRFRDPPAGVAGGGYLPYSGRSCAFAEQPRMACALV